MNNPKIFNFTCNDKEFTSYVLKEDYDKLKSDLEKKIEESKEYYLNIYKNAIKDKNENWCLFVDERAKLSAVEHENKVLLERIKRLENPIGINIIESDSVKEGNAIFVDIYQHNKDKEEIARLKNEVTRLNEKLGGVRLIVREDDYENLNKLYYKERGKNIVLRTAGDALYHSLPKAVCKRLTADDCIAIMNAWRMANDEQP